MNQTNSLNFGPRSYLSVVHKMIELKGWATVFRVLSLLKLLSYLGVFVSSAVVLVSLLFLQNPVVTDVAFRAGGWSILLLIFVWVATYVSAMAYFPKLWEAGDSIINECIRCGLTQDDARKILTSLVGHLSLYKVKNSEESSFFDVVLRDGTNVRVQCYPWDCSLTVERW